MAAVIQKSFAGGEVAPSLFARVDLTKYATGLRRCRNWLVLRHGGVANRPGTTYVASVKDHTKRIRPYKFVFNAEQTYFLEFGNQYLRFFRNGAPLTVSGVAAWSGVATYAVGDLVNRNGLYYYAILTHTNQEPPSTTYWYALTGTIYEIPTPYLEADLTTLQFAQSADIITIVHPSYVPRELARTGHTAWTLTAITFAPGIPAPTGVTNSGASGTAAEWVVTAVASETFEESLASTPTGSSSTPSSGSPITVSWTPAASAQEYNIYKRLNGIYGLIGVAMGTAFVDNGLAVDTDSTPPTARNPFEGTDNFPSTVGYWQQRILFANTNNNPETVYASRTANFKNFTASSPLQDDDAVTFRLAGKQVNAVRHLLDLDQLIIMTSGSEWSVGGDAAQILTPDNVNARQKSYNGSSTLPPIIVVNSVLFVQARGGAVRDLFNDALEGYKGNDLTIFASHLFDGHTLLDWDYQNIPQSIIWAVRDDGTLLGLTYVREHQVLAWHRHDTDGVVEGVCVVPEGNEDAVYLVVRRTISGASVRYIERMASRFIEAIVDAVFIDCSLEYDGRNTTSTTMTLSQITIGGGAGPAIEETGRSVFSGVTEHGRIVINGLTESGRVVFGTAGSSTTELHLTSTAALFAAGDLGNAVFLYESTGDVLRLTITAFLSSMEVVVVANRTVPASLLTTPQLVWSKAVDAVAGLSHLEGKAVSIFADGFVVANPNNPAYQQRTVTAGAVTLDQPYAVIRVGLPITADLETLDIDTPQGETLSDKKQNISRVSMFVESSRGLWAGSTVPISNIVGPGSGLTEIKVRDAEGYDDPVRLATEVLDVNIESQWSTGGRVFIRQSDPLPATILSIVPAGLVPFRG